MMCERLLAAGVPGLHMYTLNMDHSAVKILRSVKLLSEKVDENGVTVENGTGH